LFVSRSLRTAATSLPLIVVAALAIRLIFAWNYQAHTPHRALGAIPFLFEPGNIAYSLARGHGFGSPLRIASGPTAWMPPLYPLLLSSIMRILGIYTFPSWVAAVSVNICFSALTCVPVYHAGRRVGGAGVGAAAAWLWAVFPNAILLSFESLWDTSLSALLCATAMWATLRLADTDHARDWGAYGFLWGVILMANAAVLSLFPPWLGWAAYRRWKTGLGNTSLRNGALACGIVILCCIPWTLRNYLVLGAAVPLRSSLGLQLWVGNNPDAQAIWLGQHHPISDTVERARFLEIGEIAYMEEKRNKAVRYLLSHPGRDAELIGGRFVLFWTGGTLHPIHDLVNKNAAWFRYVLIFNLAAAFGAFFGLVFVFRRRSIYAFPLAAALALFPWAYYLTLALPRYRHPIDPVLMLLTAVAIMQPDWWRRLALKSWGRGKAAPQ
jgi:hypothetical protein